jgi:hypothetical protein
MRLSLKQFVIAILVLAISVGFLDKLSDMGEQAASFQSELHVLDSDKSQDIAADFFDQALPANFYLPDLGLVSILLSLLILIYSPPYPRPILRPPLI